MNILASGNGYRVDMLSKMYLKCSRKNLAKVEINMTILTCLN